MDKELHQSSRDFIFLSSPRSIVIPRSTRANAYAVRSHLFICGCHLHQIHLLLFSFSSRNVNRTQPKHVFSTFGKQCQFVVVTDATVVFTREQWRWHVHDAVRTRFQLLVTLRFIKFGQTMDSYWSIVVNIVHFEHAEFSRSTIIDETAEFFD